MFCGNCGAKMQDGDKFCGSCGAVVDAAENVPTAGPGGAYGTGTSKSPKKKLPKSLIGIIAVVVAVAVLLVVLVGSMGGPAAKVGKALNKTVQAYADAGEKLKLPDISGLLEEGAYSADISAWIGDVPGAEEMEGLGVRAGIDVNLPKQKLGMSATPYYGSADLLTAQLLLDGANMYAASAEVAGDTVYTVSTATLGQDLVELGADVDGLEELSFNIFELIEKFEEVAAGNEEAVKAIEKATKELVKSIEIEKTGSETIDVNDNDVKCTAYHVIIPQDALETYLGAVEDAYKSMNSTDAYVEILESIGMPMDELDMDDFEDMEDSMDESFEVMEEALDMLGDIELDLYLSDGYVMSAVYEGEIEGTEMVMSLDLGGGKNYVDDLSLVIEVEHGGEVIIASTGDHAAKSGTFTDETVIEVEEDGYGSYTVLSSEMSYVPGAEDNFEWALEADGTVFEMNGTVSGGKNEMNVRLEEVSVSSYGDEVSFGLECIVGAYKAEDMSTKNAVEILKLSEDELMEVGEELGYNMMDWAESLSEEYPDLFMYLYYMF